MEFQAHVKTSLGFGLDRVNSDSLKNAHSKALKLHGEKLISTSCPETGEEIFANIDTEN